jgi:hypothetical protein
MTTRDIGAARVAARDIIRRIVGDEAFANQVRDDPHATLLAAGFPEWALDDFVTHDLGIEPEVDGYLMSECSVTGVLWIDEDGSNLN